ncbi:MAG: hypothetical protein GXP59_06600 [Deltaproteobacteria bacterium]|nr:hypothetical protein [Deltaproteobacteria bacterium]
MICCNNLFRRGNSGIRSVICLKWVLPIRIIAVLNMIANSGFVVWRVILARLSRTSVVVPLNMLLMLLLAIHLLICWIALRECQRSVLYHRQLQLRAGRPKTGISPEKAGA